MRRHLNPRYKQLLQLLSDGRFHSGTELSGIMETSRTTIAKYVRQIQGLGLDVYVVKGKGYALPNTIQLLDQDLIRRETGGIPLHFFDMIDSTNSYMMSYLDRFSPGSCVLAETQTMGVGRGSTSWISPLGCQVIMSMYWRISPAAITGLSLAMGIATIRALRKLGVPDVGLKWPNDVCSGPRKLAGILVESRSTPDDAFHVVVGTGLNVVPTRTLRTAEIGAVSLDELTGGKVSRNETVIALIREYRSMLANFEQSGIESLQEEWNSLDLHLGCRIRLINKISGDTIIEGTERGIDHRGCIVIETESGRREAFSVGDVSLRF